MTDALWNGIIGAGGAAICCAVYYGCKSLSKGIRKFRVKPSTMNNDVHKESLTEPVNEEKKITITIPTKRQIFTKVNFKALMLLIIACFSITWAIELQYTYNMPDIEPTLYKNDISLDTEMLCYNIIATGNLGHFLSRAFFYLFWIIGLVSFTYGITGFSFKKS